MPRKMSLKTGPGSRRKRPWMVRLVMEMRVRDAGMKRSFLGMLPIDVKSRRSVQKSANFLEVPASKVLQEDPGTSRKPTRRQKGRGTSRPPSLHEPADRRL